MPGREQVPERFDIEPVEPPRVSPDAEVAVWSGAGPMIELHGDRVEGWISPASLVAALAAAANDDEAGIRAALVRSDPDA